MHTEKRNSDGTDVKKKQFQVGGTLVSREGCGRPCAPREAGTWGSWARAGWGEQARPRATAHVLLETSWGRVHKRPDQAEKSPEHQQGAPFHSSRGTSHRVQHDQICVLHKQVLSEGQFGNLSRVLTFVSFNSVIPEEIIRNVHKDLCPTRLITTLFITAQSPKIT